MESYKLFFEIIAGGLAVLTVIWGYLKITYIYKEKFLFVTNLHILPRTFWDLIKERYKIKEFGEHDHAFRPLIFLPPHLKPYMNLNQGEKVILECKAKDGDILSITTEAYWIPESLQPWCNLRHPMMSLITRRYFGIERPLFQNEQQAPSGWKLIRHPNKQLDPLHKADERNPEKLIWATSEDYSFRFFNPGLRKITNDDDDDALIEYCGLSIRVKRKSIFHIG